MLTVAEVRVLMADTDAMGIVYHANYLRWFEVGRCELIRKAGLAYRDMEAMGFNLPVVESWLRFRAPARYDDQLAIAAGVAKLSRVSVTFGYRILRSGDAALLCEGETYHACTDAKNKVTRFPPEILKTLERARSTT